MRKSIHATRRPLGGITVTRIVREHQIIESSSTGGTIGNYVDEFLARAAAEGHSIQTVELNFEPEQWAEIAETHYSGYADPSLG